MLELENIRSGYAAGDVLKSVSLRVGAGQIVTLLGANGAGKTTTLKTIAGLIPVRTGCLMIGGRDMTGRRPYEVIAAGVATVPERRGLFPEMTVQENLMMGAYIRNDREIKGDLERILGIFPVLAQRLSQVAGTLSGGEQQMVAIARALMARPKLLMVDELSLGLAPQVVSNLMGVLRDIRSQGVAVLLVEQNARQALSVADYGYVLEVGEVVMAGPAPVLSASDRLAGSYLGAGKR